MSGCKDATAWIICASLLLAWVVGISNRAHLLEYGFYVCKVVGFSSLEIWSCNSYPMQSVHPQSPDWFVSFILTVILGHVISIAKHTWLSNVVHYTCIQYIVINIHILKRVSQQKTKQNVNI